MARTPVPKSHIKCQNCRHNVEYRERELVMRKIDDKRYYFMKCPYCESLLVAKIERIKYLG